MAERVLVTGGVRSGKSAHAERLLVDRTEVVYLATLHGRAGDADQAERIARHRARRPEQWDTREVADGAGRLTTAVAEASPDAALLLDGLGVWLAEHLAELDEALGELDAFWREAAVRGGGPVIVVAEEAGLGLLPGDAGSRRWLDALGYARQRLAADADRVQLVVAGRVLDLSDPAADSSRRGTPAGAVRGGATPAGPIRGGATPADPLREHGDAMAQPGELDFAVNVHWEGPPTGLRDALRSAAEDAVRYPDPTDAATATAERFGRQPDDVLVTAGATDAIWLLAFALPVRRACVVHPQFTEPEVALRAAGVPVHRAYRRPCDDWRLDPSAVPDDADLVAVGNPTNPTGALDCADAVAALCREDRVTVVDEAFMDFVADEDGSVAGRRDLPGLVVLRSVTKLWAIPGIRAGVLLAEAGLRHRLAAHHRPWPAGAPALAALRWCAEDDTHRRRVAALVADARHRLVDDLAALGGVRAWPATANYVLLRVPDGPRVAAALAGHGIAVRRSTFPGLDTDHLRVAVRAPDDNARLVRALSAAVEGASS